MKLKKEIEEFLKANDSWKILEYFESITNNKCPQLNTSIDNLKEGF